MPSPTEIIERIGEVEGRVSVVESSLQFGAEKFESINKSLKEIRDDFKTFQGWVRGLVLTVAGAALLFGADTIKDLLAK